MLTSFGCYSATSGIAFTPADGHKWDIPGERPGSLPLARQSLQQSSASVTSTYIPGYLFPVQRSLDGDDVQIVIEEGYGVLAVQARHVDWYRSDRMARVHALCARFDRERVARVIARARASARIRAHRAHRSPRSPRRRSSSHRTRRATTDTGGDGDEPPRPRARGPPARIGRAAPKHQAPGGGLRVLGGGRGPHRRLVEPGRGPVRTSHRRARDVSTVPRTGEALLLPGVIARMHATQIIVCPQTARLLRWRVITQH